MTAQDLSGFYQGTTTLIAGLAAVIGAYWLGRRQIAISQRQTEIQDRQMNLAERTHNAQLFERRFKVYEKISGAILEMISYADDKQDKAFLDFIYGVRLARILYRDEVNVALDAIEREVGEFRYTERALKSGEVTPGRSVQERNIDARNILNDRLKHMIGLFGYELKLGGR